jgi:hypothetical protein
MESKTAKDIESEVRAIMADDNAFDAEAMVETIGTNFDEADVLDAINMASRVYCQSTESTRVGVVEAITQGIAFIPMDNLRLKEAIVTDEIVHGAGNMPSTWSLMASITSPELDPFTVYGSGRKDCSATVETNIASPVYTYLWELSDGNQSEVLSDTLLFTWRYGGLTVGATYWLKFTVNESTHGLSATDYVTINAIEYQEDPPGEE